MNLSSLKAAPKAKAKAEKPTLPDPHGQFAQLVTSAISAKAAADAQTATLDQAKASFANAVIGHLFVQAHGQANPEDTYQILCPTGKAMVSVKNAYKVPEDLAPVRRLLGEHADTYLVPSVTISIDASAIPVRVQQFVIDELIKVARTADFILGVEEGDGPCFNAISVKQATGVDKAFHADRHRLFTPAENIVIQQAMPCVVSTKLEY